jgi:heme/copper-type cytochrome/quinol oxidase subunit 3
MIFDMKTDSDQCLYWLYIVVVVMWFSSFFLIFSSDRNRSKSNTMPVRPVDSVFRNQDRLDRMRAALDAGDQEIM